MFVHNFEFGDFWMSLSDINSRFLVCHSSLVIFALPIAHLQLWYVHRLIWYLCSAKIWVKIGSNLAHVVVWQLTLTSVKSSKREKRDRSSVICKHDFVYLLPFSLSFGHNLIAFSWNPALLSNRMGLTFQSISFQSKSHSPFSTLDSLSNTDTKQKQVLALFFFAHNSFCVDHILIKYYALSLA